MRKHRRHIFRPTASRVPTRPSSLSIPRSSGSLHLGTHEVPNGRFLSASPYDFRRRLLLKPGSRHQCLSSFIPSTSNVRANLRFFPLYAAAGLVSRRRSPTRRGSPLLVVLSGVGWRKTAAFLSRESTPATQTLCFEHAASELEARRARTSSSLAPCLTDARILTHSTTALYSLILIPSDCDRGYFVQRRSAAANDVTILYGTSPPSAYAPHERLVPSSSGTGAIDCLYPLTELPSLPTEERRASFPWYRGCDLGRLLSHPTGVATRLSVVA
ncbi:hypothetical protein C8J57DRAFT_1520232 [Mycena rebaudengoi]|nr:hypothetical protein C8J57DRAFT_1520232 [Mycena rebaudengoi]